MTSLKTGLVALAALAALVCTSRASASTLYAASAAGGPGALYKLNSATGAVVQNIGPTNDVAGANYPITGLAFHPTTGVLYGSTGNSEAAAQARLVIINPATGQVTVVGSFDAGPTNSSGVPATMADIAFDAAGNLYGVGSIGGPQLYSINTATGKATVIGSTGLTSTTGGGLAVSAAGTFYGTPSASRFGTYDSVTGAFNNIGNPNKPSGGGYGALDYDGSVLYGLNVGSGSPAPTNLVIIDPSNAGVTLVGASLDRLDAIAFRIPEPNAVALLGAAMAAALPTRRRRS